MRRNDPKSGPMPNPILQRVKKAEDRLDGHDREIAAIHTEIAEHDKDIALLADILHRGKIRSRMRLKSRFGAARGRGR